MPLTDEQRLSVVANAIGYEMLRHDGRPTYTTDEGVPYVRAGQDEIQWCRAAAQRVLTHLAHASDDEVAHGCPAAGSGVTTCCGRSPFELPPTDRLTTDNDAVTCQPTTMRIEGPAAEHTPRPNASASPGVPTCRRCGHRFDAHGDTGCRWTEAMGPICPCPLTIEAARRPNPSADSYGG